MRFAKIAEEAGADFFIVQSTVTTARHVATEYEPARPPAASSKHLSIPLIVGNCVTYEACLELMQTRRRRAPDRRGPGRRVHEPRGARPRRAPGDGHRGLGGRARLLLQADRPLRADHHRRRHDDRRRHLQGARVGRRRGHDRLGLRARPGGPGPRLSLGHGDAALEPAARHAHPGGRRRDPRADPLRARVHRRRHAEPGGRHPDVHGLGRRHEHPRAPA